MNEDERQIRDLVQRWIAYTKAGDLQGVLGLMSDDVVFLIPGCPPMTKQAFAAVSQEQSKSGTPAIEGVSEIQEIKVLGDWAYMWTKLKIEVRPTASLEPMVRAGHTLSILKKESGKWLIARDANLLAPSK